MVGGGELLPNPALSIEALTELGFVVFAEHDAPARAKFVGIVDENHAGDHSAIVQLLSGIGPNDKVFVEGTDITPAVQTFGLEGRDVATWENPRAYALGYLILSRMLHLEQRIETARALAGLTYPYASTREGRLLDGYFQLEASAATTMIAARNDGLFENTTRAAQEVEGTIYIIAGIDHWDTHLRARLTEQPGGFSLLMPAEPLAEIPGEAERLMRKVLAADRAALKRAWQDGRPITPAVLAGLE